jgi:hypothetical protein
MRGSISPSVLDRIFAWARPSHVCREGSLEIKPGETVTLRPSGLHVMLTNLKRSLNKGDMIEATFQFDKAGIVEVIFPVVAIGAIGPGGAPGGGGMTHMNTSRRIHFACYSAVAKSICASTEHSIFQFAAGIDGVALVAEFWQVRIRPYRLSPRYASMAMLSALASPRLSKLR